MSDVNSFYCTLGIRGDLKHRSAPVAAALAPRPAARDVAAATTPALNGPHMPKRGPPPDIAAGNGPEVRTQRLSNRGRKRSMIRFPGKPIGGGSERPGRRRPAAAEWPDGP